MKRWLRSEAVQGWGVFAVCILLLGYGLSQQIARELDFQAFYVAGRILRSSAAQLYELGTQMRVEHAVVAGGRFMPFYHLSYEALLYVPFSFLSYRWAYVAYMAWNLSLLGMAYAVAPRTAETSLRFVPRMLLFFASVPVLFCLGVGQNSILFLLVLCVVWRCVEDGRLAAAGALLGLGLFKLPIAAVLAVLLGVRLGWRFLAGFAAAALGVGLLCVRIAGVNGMYGWLRLTREAAMAPNQGALTQTAVAVVPQGMPNLNGFLYLMGMRHAAAGTAMEIDLALSLAVLLGCVVLVRRSTVPMAFAVAVACALLVGQHVGLHDMALLLVPVLLGTGRMQRAWVAVSYALPIAIFATGGPELIALEAIVPILFLAAAASEAAAGRPSKLKGVAAAR
jgi:hypothetical protein